MCLEEKHHQIYILELKLNWVQISRQLDHARSYGQQVTPKRKKLQI